MVKKTGAPAKEHEKKAPLGGEKKTPAGGEKKGGLTGTPLPMPGTPGAPKGISDNYTQEPNDVLKRFKLLPPDRGSVKIPKTCATFNGDPDKVPGAETKPTPVSDPEVSHWSGCYARIKFNRAIVMAIRQANSARGYITAQYLVVPNELTGIKPANAPVVAGQINPAYDTFLDIATWRLVMAEYDFIISQKTTATEMATLYCCHAGIPFPPQAPDEPPTDVDETESAGHSPKPKHKKRKKGDSDDEGKGKGKAKVPAWLTAGHAVLGALSKAFVEEEEDEEEEQEEEEEEEEVTPKPKKKKKKKKFILISDDDAEYDGEGDEEEEHEGDDEEADGDDDAVPKTPVKKKKAGAHKVTPSKKSALGKKLPGKPVAGK